MLIFCPLLPKCRHDVKQTRVISGLHKAPLNTQTKLERGKNEWKGTVHEIKEIHLPEDRELNHKATELGEYDLAILVMKKPFIFTMKVKPINIHIEQKHIRELKGSMYLEVNDLTFYNKFLIYLYIIIKDKEKCDTAGWGKMVQKGQPNQYPESNYTGELQEALVPIVELERCAKMWKDDPEKWKKWKICAGGLNTRDACMVCTKL